MSKASKFNTPGSIMEKLRKKEGDYAILALLRSKQISVTFEGAGLAIISNHSSDYERMGMIVFALFAGIRSAYYLSTRRTPQA